MNASSSSSFFFFSFFSVAATNDVRIVRFTSSVFALCSEIDREHRLESQRNSRKTLIKVFVRVGENTVVLKVSVNKRARGEEGKKQKPTTREKRERVDAPARQRELFAHFEQRSRVSLLRVFLVIPIL